MLDSKPVPSALAPLQILWHQRRLLRRLAWREVTGRYRGAFFGLLWPLLTPLLMLAIYTFVFGTVFRARWSVEPARPLDFALTLFAGLIVFNFFAEGLNRAPGLITSNANYVKKVVFPLELLPLASLLAALFHAVINLGVLALALLATGRLAWTVLWLPVVWAPLFVLTAGLGWWLAALGVFVRDAGQVVAMATTALLFLSPVFYPVSALPQGLCGWLFLNPLTLPIEQTRAVMILGQAPDGWALALYSVAALTLAWGGLIWFEKTRLGFADVI